MHGQLIFALTVQPELQNGEAKWLWPRLWQTSTISAPLACRLPILLRSGTPCKWIAQHQPGSDPRQVQSSWRRCGIHLFRRGQHGGKRAWDQAHSTECYVSRHAAARPGIRRHHGTPLLQAAADGRGGAVPACQCQTTSSCQLVTLALSEQTKNLPFINYVPRSTHACHSSCTLCRTRRVSGTHTRHSSQGGVGLATDFMNLLKSRM